MGSFLHQRNVAAARSRSARFGLPGRQPADDGFVLLESIISITLITIIMAALGVFFTTTIRTSNHLRHDQAAAQLADSAVERVRSIDATSILSGRDQASVISQNSAAPTNVSANWLNTMSAAWDTRAPAGSGQIACPSVSACAILPTTATNQTLNSQVYGTSYYVGNCYRAKTSPATSCSASGGSSYIQYLRVVIVIQWTEGSCSNCLYVTSTLADPSANPIFNLNAAPPPMPTFTPPSNQTSAVGDTVSLSLSASSGVPPFTWKADGLPAGLAMSSAGVITGSPTAVSPALTVKVTLTDAFARTSAISSFTWTVLAALTAPKPADQSSTWRSAITNLTLTASGGSGTGYVWSDPSRTLPPGLSLSSSGVISGMPTAAGNYAVQVGVKDSANRAVSVAFNWTVSYPPLAASQSTVSSTLNTATSLTMAATGGSGSYSWSDPTSTLSATGLNLTLTAAGAISGTPTAAGSYPISVLVTDATAGLTKTVSFTWTVITLPSVMSPGPQSGTVTRPVNVPLTYSCPASPCTITATGLPTGLSISGGSIIGTLPSSVSGASATFNGIQLTIKDASNRSSSAAATFSWLVNAAPTLAVTNQVDITGGDVDAVPVTVSRGTGPYTFSISSKPAGTTMTDTSIGEITGTTTTTQTLTNIKMTVVDASGYTVVSSAFTWTVKATVVLRNVASTSYCAVSAVSGGTTFLGAGNCSSGLSLTYTNSQLLQTSGLCLKAVTTSPAVTRVTCDSSSTAQQWLFNADNSIVNVGLNKCLNLPTGATNGTALDLVTCAVPLTTRMQWSVQ